MTALVPVPCLLSMVIGSDWYRYLGLGLPAVVLLAAFADVSVVGLLIAVGFELLVSAAVFRDVTHQPAVVLMLIAIGSLVVLLGARATPKRTVVSRSRSSSR